MQRRLHVLQVRWEALLQLSLLLLVQLLVWLRPRWLRHLALLLLLLLDHLTLLGLLSLLLRQERLLLLRMQLLQLSRTRRRARRKCRPQAGKERFAPWRQISREERPRRSWPRLRDGLRP